MMSFWKLYILHWQRIYVVCETSEHLLFRRCLMNCRLRASLYAMDALNIAESR